MIKYSGALRKMTARYADPIAYNLCFANNAIHLNPFLGKNLSLVHSGKIFCIQCDRGITRSFLQGYCYPCYQRLMECNLCLINPERCTIEKKPCPKDDWAHAHCGQSHIVYLSNTSDLKVGITRETQMLTRWIDQGAVQAIALFRVSNRYRAGMAEVAIKSFVKDKTNWRTMLKNDVARIDMQQNKKTVLAKVATSLATTCETFADELKELETAPLSFNYPVLEFPQKVKSLSFDKTPEITAKLLGIKGQYLILDIGVLNLRKFGGYEIEARLC